MVRRCTEPGTDLHRSLERITRTERFGQMQTLGVQHRQPSEQLGVETVGLGVLGEVVPQIR